MTKDEALKLALDVFERMNHKDSIFYGDFNREVFAIKVALEVPQRTWVGLTDEEIKSIWLSGKDYGDDWLDVQNIARAIEAKLKEKNSNL